MDRRRNKIRKKWEGSNKLNSKLDLWNKLNEGNTLQEVQQYIKDVIEIRGFSNQEIEKTMLLLLEEVGELAKSIRKMLQIWELIKIKLIIMIQ